MSTATIQREARLTSTEATAREQSILNLMHAARGNVREQNSKPRIPVADLRPSTPVGRIELLILRRYPRRTVRNENWSGSLAAACGRDESGLVGVVLWGGQVDQVSTGDVVRIENGWCRLSNGEKVVSTGRTGRLTVLGD